VSGQEGEREVVRRAVVVTDMARHHRGDHVEHHLVEVEPGARGPRDVDVGELDRVQGEHEPRLVHERAGRRVVEDRREVVHPSDQGPLGELADRAVAVGPVVRILRHGENRPGEHGEQDGCRGNRSLRHFSLHAQRRWGMVGVPGRLHNCKKD
jgi:hypothetical protein